MTTRDCGSKDSMSLVHWIDAVICAARVSVEQSRPHRSRLHLWFNTGEPVWMAADSLKAFVRGHEISDRLDSERRIIHRARLGLPITGDHK